MKKSFSIVELLIVVAAIIILFTVTVPRMSFVNRFVLQNEVDKLFTTFSFLQQRAIASNQEQKIVFNLKENSYSYNLSDDKKSVHSLPQVVHFGFLQNALGPPSAPKKKISRAVSFKKVNENERQAVFLTDGKVKPGTVYFVDKTQNDMMALTCPISQVSYIRKYKYDGGRWVCLK